MHIPDGYLSNPICAATTAASIIGVVGAATLLSRTIRVRPAAIAAVAAGVFAAQMINFPVAHGTSGHLIGAALATALLGPLMAVLVIAAVLATQCIVFGDGGVYALGANIFNMSLLSVGVCQLAIVAGGYVRIGRSAAVAIGSCCSVVVASIACSLELSLSGTQPLGMVLPEMLRVHFMIGVGEAVITVVVLAVVTSSFASRLPHGGMIGLAAALLTAILLAPWASTSPDGLEYVANLLGFANRATTVLAAPLSEYSVAGISSSAVSTAIAGAAGTLIVFGAVLAIARLQTAAVSREIAG